MMTSKAGPIIELRIIAGVPSRTIAYMRDGETLELVKFGRSPQTCVEVFNVMAVSPHDYEQVRRALEQDCAGHA